MNYYERHLGDYTKDTAHLSLLEHGAYTLLLDRYYSTEKGIPEAQAHRVARARTPEEKEAVDVVLNEFFTLANGLWIKNRVEAELAKYQIRIQHSQTNGLKGGRPKKGTEENQAKPAGLSVGSKKEPSDNLHHTPSTIHQTPDLRTGFKHTELDTPRDEGDQPEGACVEPIPIKNKTTQAGLSCKAMVKQGVQGCNPSHPTLIALIEAGATETEFANAARDAVTRGHHSFAYVVGIVKRRREEAAKMVLHQGRLPNKQEALEEENRRVAAAWMPPEMRGARNAH